MRFRFGQKSHFSFQSALYLFSHKLRRSETQTGMEFWSKWNFKPEIFMWTKFTRSETNQSRLLRLMNMCVWRSLRVLFHWDHFDRNEFLFRVIKFHVNSNRNEMPTHVHQNIGSFWNAAVVKRNVNRTCFHAGLKSQTGRSSFSLSYKRGLSFR